MEKLRLRHRLYELWYWHVSWKTRKFVPWVARSLPRSVKYWVVIHGMVEVEPNGDPSAVTGLELLELWKDPKIKKRETKAS